MSVPAMPSLFEPVEAPDLSRVEQWTASQAADALSATHISSPSSHPVVRIVDEVLNIPLDDSVHERQLEQPRETRETEAVHTVYHRRIPIRRDSLNRREALLKGKEGSRQRRRWENDRLLNNPYAEPPLPSDWEVRPTHPPQRVPYFLAPLWDAEYARLAQQRKKQAERKTRPANKEAAVADNVKQELKARLKRSKGAKALLQDLEVEIRQFIEQWDEKQRELKKDGLVEPDSEDEEIVFVGRNGMTTSDDRNRLTQGRNLEKDKLVFQGLADDQGAAFGRYLAHSLGKYYSLRTWSETTGQPACRQAFVGLKVDPKTRQPTLPTEIPRPLWLAV